MITLEELASFIEEYPGFPMITETGHTFLGVPHEDKSSAVGKHKAAWISTSGKDPTIENIGHEAQHLIDVNNRDPETTRAMDFDYATMRAKRDATGDPSIYTDHHSELRAKARELLTFMKGLYEQDNKGYDLLEDYVEASLRRAKISNKQTAKYMSKFLRDELGKGLGLENLPSDVRIKDVDRPSDPSLQNDKEALRKAIRQIDQTIGGKRY